MFKSSNFLRIFITWIDIISIDYTDTFIDFNVVRYWILIFRRLQQLSISIKSYIFRNKYLFVLFSRICYALLCSQLSMRVAGLTRSSIVPTNLPVVMYQKFDPNTCRREELGSCHFQKVWWVLFFGSMMLYLCYLYMRVNIGLQSTKTLLLSYGRTLPTLN